MVSLNIFRYFRIDGRHIRTGFVIEKYGKSFECSNFAIFVVSTGLLYGHVDTWGRKITEELFSYLHRMVTREEMKKTLVTPTERWDNRFKGSVRQYGKSDGWEENSMIPEARWITRNARGLGDHEGLSSRAKILSKQCPSFLHSFPLTKNPRMGGGTS